MKKERRAFKIDGVICAFFARQNQTFMRWSLVIYVSMKAVIAVSCVLIPYQMMVIWIHFPWLSSWKPFSIIRIPSLTVYSCVMYGRDNEAEEAVKPVSQTLSIIHASKGSSRFIIESSSSPSIICFEYLLRVSCFGTFCPDVHSFCSFYSNILPLSSVCESLNWIIRRLVIHTHDTTSSAGTYVNSLGNDKRRSIDSKSLNKSWSAKSEEGLGLWSACLLLASAV